MIPANPEPWEPDLWRVMLKNAIRDSQTLLARLGIPAIETDPLPAFPVRVPEPWLRRMRPGDPRDPLLRQVLATSDERVQMQGFTADALGEATAVITPGLLKKYAHRALLLASPACAIHCRYCFRREFPYEAHGPAHLETAVAAVAADDSLTEIILSGGDPLTLPDDRLAGLIAELGEIAHLKRLRIHTRLPIVLPERITAGLLAMLSASRLKVVVVIHCNHPAELDGDTRRAMQLLRRAGATLLNQAVLLRGVNDSADTLSALSESLFEQGVLPYYLHLLDRVTGTQHFEVDENTALKLIATLRSTLPGYLVPKLVREIAGAESKTAIY